jgi:hypothetical protein
VRFTFSFLKMSSRNGFPGSRLGRLLKCKLRRIRRSPVLRHPALNSGRETTYPPLLKDIHRVFILYSWVYLPEEGHIEMVHGLRHGLSPMKLSKSWRGH